MPGNILEIKKQLRSLKNSAKVTKAMELVSGSKMRKAVSMALASRKYSYTLLSLLNRVAPVLNFDAGDALSNFFNSSKIANRDILVVISSDRGLCGAFNSNIVRLAVKFLKNNSNKTEVICVGKKAAIAIKSRGFGVDMIYAKDDKFQGQTISKIARYVLSEVKTGLVGRVLIVFTDFKSALTQRAVIRPLVPFNLKEPITEVSEDDLLIFTKEEGEVLASGMEYSVEPDPRSVIEKLVEDIGEVFLYQALLENNASEYSARMMAMKNATKAAGEMFDELLSLFNKTRQGKITQELAEISAGKMALEI